MAPVGKKPSHAGKAVVAGGISGAVEICCTYPVSRLTCDPITAPPTPSVPPSTVRARLLAQIEFTKTMQQLSTQNVSAMEVVKNTLRNRGVFGLYKVRDTRPNSAHATL